MIDYRGILPQAVPAFGYVGTPVYANTPGIAAGIAGRLLHAASEIHGMFIAASMTRSGYSLRV
jgi:hypothetical protein